MKTLYESSLAAVMLVLHALRLTTAMYLMICMNIFHYSTNLVG